MRRDSAWVRWAMSSARTWTDIERIVPVTGIDAVDRDHRGLLEYALALNHLSDDTALGFGSELLERQKRILEGLLDSAVRHFNREEAIIRKLGAPNLELQKSQHGRIVAMLGESSKDFLEGRLTVSPGLRRAVFSWIVDHIEGTDYETFRSADFSPLFAAARRWDDLWELIRSTGVDSIDAEHHVIVDAILEAVSALRSDRRTGPGPGTAERFAALLSVCERHFSHEEALMERLGIPGLPRQRENHGTFLSRLRELAACSSEFDCDLPGAESLARELLAWLADHVNRLDVDSFSGGDWLVEAFETRPAEDLYGLVRATGEPLVDSQHLEFVRLASAFGAALLEQGAGQPGRGPSKTLEKNFEGLVAYAGRHFADEETRFPKDAVGIVQRHREEHRALLSGLSGYRDALREGRIRGASAARGLVLGWWIRHTNGIDIDTFGSAGMGGGQHVA